MIFFFFSETLCTSIVPTLIGMARAIGRSSDDNTPLINLLFPLPSQCSAAFEPLEDASSPPKRPFTKFRSIFPRTLSSHVITPESPTSPTPGSTENPADFRRERSPSPMAPTQQKSGSADDMLDPTVRYFNKVGSSFTRTKPWGFEIIPEEDHLKFSSSQLQTLVSVVGIILIYLLFEIFLVRLPGIVWFEIVSEIPKLSFTKLNSVWHKAKKMWHSVRIKLTNNGLLALFSNYYSLIIYSAQFSLV